MDKHSQETKRAAEVARYNTKDKVSKPFRLLPHIATGIVGLIALADLLAKYGPDTTQMITSVINQLYALTPDNVNMPREAGHPN